MGDFKIMKKITTDDCKKYLDEVYCVSDWKRKKKFRTENGFVARDFTRCDGMIYRVLTDKSDSQIIVAEEYEEDVAVSGKSSNKIKRLDCTAGHKGTASFIVQLESKDGQGDGGNVWVDKNGKVTETDDNRIRVGEHISKLSERGIYIDDIMGMCDGPCEDYAGLIAYFEDGTVMGDDHDSSMEEKIFFKAFGMKIEKSPKRLENERKEKEIEQEKLNARTPEQKYIDEHFNEAIDKIKKLPEFNVAWLISKYMKGYNNHMLVAPVKLFDGREHVLSSEYLRAYLVNERTYGLIKDIMEIKI